MLIQCIIHSYLRTQLIIIVNDFSFLLSVCLSSFLSLFLIYCCLCFCFLWSPSCFYTWNGCSASLHIKKSTESYRIQINLQISFNKRSQNVNKSTKFGTAIHSNDPVYRFVFLACLALPEEALNFDAFL